MNCNTLLSEVKVGEEKVEREKVLGRYRPYYVVITERNLSMTCSKGEEKKLGLIFGIDHIRLEVVDP